MVYLVIIVGGCSAGPLTYTTLADYLPDKGMSLAAFFIWASMIANAYFFPIIVESTIGVSGCFWIYSIS